MILRSVQWHRARAPWGDMNPEAPMKDIPGEMVMVRGWVRKSNRGTPRCRAPPQEWWEEIECLGMGVGPAKDL